MADIPQLLANYDALVGVARGAGLTYGFGALNRRHVEKRVEATRLHEARFQAYAQLAQAALSRGVIDPRTSPNAEARLSEAMTSVTTAMGAIALVGSFEVLDAANKLIVAVGDETGRREPDLYRLRDVHAAFREAARKDLGCPPVEGLEP
jgi:hypothetical protein